MGNIHVKLFYFEPVIKKEMLFEEKVYRHTTDDGRRPITIAHLEPLAQVS